MSPELPVGILDGGKAGGWSRGQGEEGDEARGGLDSPGSLGFSLPRPSCPALTPAPCALNSQQCPGEAPGGISHSRPG